MIISHKLFNYERFELLSFIIGKKHLGNNVFLNVLLTEGEESTLLVEVSLSPREDLDEGNVEVHALHHHPRYGR